jgi:hypothetical protein
MLVAPLHDVAQASEAQIRPLKRPDRMEDKEQSNTPATSAPVLEALAYLPAGGGMAAEAASTAT